MKKTITIIFLLLCYMTVSSQISGPGIVDLGKTVSYSVSTTNGAQYFWSTIGNIQIISGQGTRKIKVKFNGRGEVCVAKYGNKLKPSCSCKSIVPPPPCNPNIPNPRLVVLNPNWGQQGETCGNEILEVQALFDIVPGMTVTKYDWKIAGATLHEPHTNRDYIFIRTRPTIGTYVDIDFRLHYKKCNRTIIGPWVSLRGRVVNCGFNGGVGLAKSQNSKTKLVKTKIAYDKNSERLLFNKNLSMVNYSVIGIDGKIRKKGVLEDDSSIELEGFSEGFYIISLENKGVKESIKFYISK